MNLAPPPIVFTSLMDAVSRYGAVVAGLVLGILAKYGLMLTDGKAVTWKTVAADMLIIGGLTVLVVNVSDWLGLTSNLKVAMGVMAGISSDRLIRLVRRKFEQWIAAKIEAAMPPPPQPPTPADVVLPLVDQRLPARKPEIDQLLDRLD